jgi:hypothetical protein
MCKVKQKVEILNFNFNQNTYFQKKTQIYVISKEKANYQVELEVKPWFNES